MCRDCLTAWMLAVVAAISVFELYWLLSGNLIVQ